jgi:hypothetical protein
MATYDSDFSELSTPPASDSDSADEDIDPEILAQIPQCLYLDPVLPDAGFKWYCPVPPSCEYTIDMLALTDENLKSLSLDDAQFLRGKRWSLLREPRVIENFYSMVSRHYYEHLGKQGIILRARGHLKVVIYLFNLGVMLIYIYCCR